MTIEDISEEMIKQFKTTNQNIQEINDKLYVMSKNIDTLNNKVDNLDNKLDIVIKTNSLRSANTF